eukprot:m.82249 g.82249  ORF g.82249 m.82249 type:complete len:316 (-) comp14721_c0_seq2:104-1051(-)
MPVLGHPLFCGVVQGHNVVDGNHGVGQGGVDHHFVPQVTKGDIQLGGHGNHLVCLFARQQRPGFQQCLHVWWFDKHNQRLQCRYPEMLECTRPDTQDGRAPSSNQGANSGQRRPVKIVIKLAVFYKCSSANGGLELFRGHEEIVFSVHFSVASRAGGVSYWGGIPAGIELQQSARNTASSNASRADQHKRPPANAVCTHRRYFLIRSVRDGFLRRHDRAVATSFLSPYWRGLKTVAKRVQKYGQGAVETSCRVFCSVSFEFVLPCVQFNVVPTLTASSSSWGKFNPRFMEMVALGPSVSFNPYSQGCFLPLARCR